MINNEFQVSDTLKVSDTSYQKIKKGEKNELADSHCCVFKQQIDGFFLIHVFAPIAVLSL